ncbi:MAG TPA: adenylate/guanylate cyclase domain-containing protein [Vulgatibacter sp.]
MSDARLLLLLPGGDRREVPLVLRATIGRQPGNTIVLLDREVSKEHALVERVGADWFFRDLGSSNGSFVNGRRTNSCMLRHGDELLMGTSTLRFETPGAANRPLASRVNVSDGETSILKALPSTGAEGFLPEGQIGSDELLRRDYEKMRIAMELGRRIVLEQDEDALLDQILEFAFDVLPVADNGVILMVDPASGQLAPKAVRCREGSEEVVVSESILRRVRESRDSVLTLDAGVDSRFATSASIVVQGIRSAMAVPLLVRDEVKGVLSIDSRKTAAAFSEKDLQLLGGVAAQASLALERTALSRQIAQEAEARAHLSRFLSPALVEQARLGKLDLQKRGQLTLVTVMFSDIRGFTQLSERVGPEETVRMLNDYFERMVDVVFRHGGVLDKFIGDALMALWGAPVGGPDDVDRALACALEMQEQIAALNAAREAEGRSPIACGIGVNTGLAVVGTMGSSKRLEFTAIGDAVNLASRLCGLAGPGEIMVSQEAMALTTAPFRTEARPPTQVKGKAQPVPLVRLLGA